MKRILKPEVLLPVADPPEGPWELLRRVQSGGGFVPRRADVEGALVRALLDLEERLMRLEAS